MSELLRPPRLVPQHLGRLHVPGIKMLLGLIGLVGLVGLVGLYGIYTLPKPFNTVNGCNPAFFLVSVLSCLPPATPAISAAGRYIDDSLNPALLVTVARVEKERAWRDRTSAKRPVT